MKANRMMTIPNVYIFTISIITMFAVQSYALGVNTHKAINIYIVNRTSNFPGYSLDEYLKNNLGIIDGVTAKFDSKIVQDWIGDGGANEDNGSRSLYHFHDPVTNKGLGINYSALDWATLPVGAQGLFLCSSWNDVRDYYLKALTSGNKTTRENYFALTFQGVGQLMHLVEDMSVPAHVRDDIHPPPFWNDGYEDWARKSVRVASQVGAYAPYRTYTPYNSSFLVSQLFDTDQYNGADPSITTSSNSIGLAEYTNANFFSGDTINSSEFPYPITDNNKKVMILYPGPSGTYYREYFLKDCSESYCQRSTSKEYNGYLLSAVDLNDYWRLTNPKPNSDKEVIPILDENVHRDYAQLLIPRAIGYSSQVLSYFFRGKIDLIVNPNNPNGYVIVNNTEEVMDGTEEGDRGFAIYYDNTNEERQQLWSGKFTLGAKGSSGNIDLPLPTDAKEPGKYMLVFKGRLGNETNAVVGRYTDFGSGYWEPWTVNPLNSNDITVNHPWYRRGFFSGTVITGIYTFDITNAEVWPYDSDIVWTKKNEDVVSSPRYPEGNKLKIKIKADILKAGTGRHTDDVEMWIYDEIGNELNLVFADSNFEGWYYEWNGQWTRSVFIGDNAGNELIIDLGNNYNFIGSPKWISVETYLRTGAHIRFTIDYIDFQK